MNRLSQKTTPETSTTYAYDAANRLTKIQGLSPAGTVPEFNYTYDKVGNRTSLRGGAAGNEAIYTYDNIYQLRNASYSAGYPFQGTAYNYDPLGNRTSTISSGTTGYNSNSLNQYTNVGAVSCSYDNNGNLTNIATNSYSYDSENRLINVVIPAQAGIQYTYDPFGRRISKTVDGVTTKFLYDGDQIIAEYDGSDNLTAKYVYGAGIDEPIRMERGGQSYYYHYDGLGSVTNLTDSTGAVAESYSYDAFGKPSATSSIGNRYMFTGREYDAETGLYYYRARYYSPEMGRFLQTDPIGYLGGLNLYTYCFNNPANWLDPWGRCGVKQDYRTNLKNWIIDNFGVSEAYADEVTDDPVVRKRFEDAWNDSSAEDPAKRHEEGGWVTKSKTGDYDTSRWPSGAQSGIHPTPKPMDAVASFHTHPNPPQDEQGRKWNQGPSSSDVNATKALGASGYVISRDTIYKVNTNGSTEEIGQRRGR